MCTEHTDNEFDDLASRNYNKLSKSTTKNGYKDGIHDGRESMFQAGFDVGYKEGFKNSFKIGRFHGLTTAAQINTSHDLLLKKPTRGHCQICIDSTLLDKSISEITAAQTSHSQSVNETLNKRYKT
ncbi:Protein YAE1 like [Pseudolycoriella hygida]|uniref:Protein YAE1 like n=1 Tax=Pseudolycoriella hygida TaxID=35572 RepID=A0A9Q0MXC1_9DIPT|nr:Protein YAE1 like [Pseudolycoriella hygida]